MNWIEPRTDWMPGDGIKASDLNRIENDTKYLYEKQILMGAMAPIPVVIDQHASRNGIVTGGNIAIPPMSRGIIPVFVCTAFAFTNNNPGSEIKQRFIIRRMGDGWQCKLDSNFPLHSLCDVHDSRTRNDAFLGRWSLCSSSKDSWSWMN